MRILVLSFYYPPDLSAGSFRAKALVAALCERAPRGTQVDVLTTLPNRYRTFSQEAAELECTDGLEIRRIGLPPHRSDIGGQSRAFLRFARQSLRHTKHRDYDLVVATSSRLMTAALGALIARRKRARLYLDIRDIFAETIGELLPPPIGWAAGRLFSTIERWTMRSADRINLVSRGFESYFRARYQDRSLAWFTNGVDEEFIALAQVRGAAGRAADESQRALRRQRWRRPSVAPHPSGAREIVARPRRFHRHRRRRTAHGAGSGGRGSRQRTICAHPFRARSC